MYIESSLSCVEFVTASTGVSFKEMREMKEEKRETCWLKDLFGFVARSWKTSSEIQMFVDFCPLGQILLPVANSAEL